MPPKAKGRKATARKMPPPMPVGEIVTDGIDKQEWVLDTSVGKGGFGEIYLATPKGKNAKEPEHVIKIEPFENGPLFSELSYYRRAAREESIKKWISQQKLKYLAVPKYITSGRHIFSGSEYRFLVMQRFGDDIEKHFRAVGSFCEDTVCYLALRLLEALHYLHESEYVHADIKGSNLLTGYGRDVERARVYLVDYGLAYRFNPGGRHADYKEDPRKAHDGTIEFTSIDAHNGVNPSRRGDLEILGYCLLQWGCGRLPWEDKLGDKNYVAGRKKEYKMNVGKLMKDCYGASSPKFLTTYMTEIFKLEYTDIPDYIKLKKIFTDQLQKRDPTKTLEWMSKSRKRPSNEEVPAAKKPCKEPVSVEPPNEVQILHTKPKKVPKQVDSEGVNTKERKILKAIVKPRKRSKPGGSSQVDGTTKPKRTKIEDRIPGMSPPPDESLSSNGFQEIISEKPRKRLRPSGSDEVDGTTKPKRTKIEDRIPGMSPLPDASLSSNSVQEIISEKPSKNRSKATAQTITSPLRRSTRRRKQVNYKDLDSSLDRSVGNSGGTRYRKPTVRKTKRTIT